MQSHSDPETEEATRLTGVLDRSSTFASDGRYQTFGDRRSFFSDLQDIIGRGPEEDINLDSIRQQFRGLKATRERNEWTADAEVLVDVLEIHANGDTGLKSTKTIQELLDTIHEIADTYDSQGGIVFGTTLDDRNAGGADGSPKDSAGMSSMGTPKAGTEPKLQRDTSSVSSGSRSSRVPLGLNIGSDFSAESGFAHQTSPGLFQSRRRSPRKHRTKRADREMRQKNKSQAHKAVTQLQQHDLRLFESGLADLNDEPSILVRRHVILLYLNPVRAIITVDKIFLVAPHSADSVLFLLLQHIGDMLQDQENAADLSPEKRSFNALLATASALHQQELTSLHKRTQNLLSSIRGVKTVPPETQEDLRTCKNLVSQQEVRSNAYRRMIRRLLDDPKELALMNLETLKKTPALYDRYPLDDGLLHSREDVAIMLEGYLMDYNTFSTELSFIQSKVVNTEDMFIATLNTAQNDLFLVYMYIVTILLLINVGMFPVTAFGTNVRNGLVLQSGPWLFWSVIGVLFTGVYMGGMVLFGYFRLTGRLPTRSSDVKTYAPKYKQEYGYN